jgi:predicted nucleic acid-binding Zn ribbon protein
VIRRREEEPEHVAVFRRVRARFGDPAIVTRDGRRRAAKAADDDPASTPFATGRDPRELGAVLDRLTTRMGWDSSLAKSDLLVGWPEIVGAEVAQHCEPIAVDEGVLSIRCDSTAWAQQLRHMRTQITTRIAQLHPLAGIESVTFLGPDAPSWKRGPRAIPGRGPRDTYG